MKDLHNECLSISAWVIQSVGHWNLDYRIREFFVWPPTKSMGGISWMRPHRERFRDTKLCLRHHHIESFQISQRQRNTKKKKSKYSQFESGTSTSQINYTTGEFTFIFVFHVCITFFFVQNEVALSAFCKIIIKCSRLESTNKLLFIYHFDCVDIVGIYLLHKI